MTTRNEAVTVLRLDTSSIPPSAAKASQAIEGIARSAQTSVGQTRNAVRQLPAQLNDVAVSIAGGQNIGLVFLQQGAQIVDSFGGVRAAIQGIGSVISPARLLLGGLAGTVGAVALAAFTGARESERLRDALILSGNAAGLTEDRLSSLAERISTTSGQTIGQTRELITSLAASGRVSGDVLESTARAVARVAELSGRSAVDVSQQFTGLLRDPAAAAARLNESYNFLNESQARRIRQLSDEGRKVEAANLVNKALTESLEGQRRELGLLETAWDAVTKKASQYWESLKSFGRPQALESQLGEARQELIRRQAALANEPQGRGANGFVNPGREAAERAVAQQELRVAGIAEALRQQKSLLDSSAERAANAGTVAEILTDKPRKPTESKPRSLEAAGLDAASVAALRSLEQTDTARLAALSAELDKLFEYRATGLFGPEIDAAIENTRTKFSDLSDQLRAAALPDAVVDLKSAFLRSEKATYAETDNFLREQQERAAKALEDIAERSRQNIQDNLADTFTRALDGQFRSIEDLWKGTINRMLAEAAAADFAALLFGKGKGGNVAGLFDGLGAFVGSLFGLPGRAGGGPVGRNGAYLVGEQGPEVLLMGGRSGTIVPNSRLSGGGGAQITLAPQIYIDARTDQAQVASLVQAGIGEAQAGMWRQLASRGLV